MPPTQDGTFTKYATFPANMAGLLKRTRVSGKKQTCENASKKIPWWSMRKKEEKRRKRMKNKANKRFHLP
jgi:hypothetical protein